MAAATSVAVRLARARSEVLGRIRITRLRATARDGFPRAVAGLRAAFRGTLIGIHLKNSGLGHLCGAQSPSQTTGSRLGPAYRLIPRMRLRPTGPLNGLLAGLEASAVFVAGVILTWATFSLSFPMQHRGGLALLVIPPALQASKNLVKKTTTTLVAAAFANAGSRGGACWSRSGKQVAGGVPGNPDVSRKKLGGAVSLEPFLRPFARDDARPVDRFATALRIISAVAEGDCRTPVVA